MKTVTVIMVVLLASILAVSCGQKVEQTAGANDSFIYYDYASAKAAAVESGKYLVLDFYTDW